MWRGSGVRVLYRCYPCVVALTRCRRHSTLSTPCPVRFPRPPCHSVPMRGRDPSPLPPPPPFFCSTTSVRVAIASLPSSGTPTPPPPTRLCSYPLVPSPPQTAAAVVRHINGRRGGQLSVSSSLTRNAVRATVQLSDCGIAGARPSIGTVRRVVRAGPGEWTGGAATTRGRSTASLASALEREIRGRGPSATSPKFSKVGCRGRCRTAARPSSAALTEDHEQQRTPGRERVVADGDCRTRSGG